VIAVFANLALAVTNQQEAVMAVKTTTKVEGMLRALKDYRDGVKEVMDTQDCTKTELAYGEGQFDAMNLIIEQMEKLFKVELS